MDIYKVRIFKDNKWHTIRTYSLYSEAHTFASQLWAEWDIKKVTIEEALIEEAN